MSLEEKQLSSKQIYDGRVVKLFVDDVELIDGNRSIREYMKHSGGAAVLYVEDGKVLLVKQYRYAYGEEIWEIPAGKLEPNEDPFDAAKRELEEETGYIPTQLVKLFQMYPTPGYTNERLYIFWAKECIKGHVHLDEDEFVNMAFLPLEEVVSMVKNDKIRDAKTVAAILQYQLIQKEEL